MRSTLSAMVSRDALIGAMPVVIALVLGGVISFSYNRLLKSYRDDVDHTFQVIAAIDTALLQLQDAETGQRGFIITGDADYLAPFETGRKNMSDALSQLSGLVSDNADQQRRSAGLRELARNKLDELEETISVRRIDGFDPARMKVAGNAGKETMDRIRGLAGVMRSAETTLLEARLANSRFAERMLILVAVICVALSIAGRFAAFLIRQRREKAT